MSIEQGLSRVVPIVDSFSVAGVLDPRIYGAFDVNVMEYADQRAQNFAAPAPCRAQYDSHKPELQMWFFGGMLCEYVAGLLAKKVEEGHCNEHRKKPTWYARAGRRIWSSTRRGALSPANPSLKPPTRCWNGSHAFPVRRYFPPETKSRGSNLGICAYW